MVNHPPHYTFGRFEVKDVLQDWFMHDALLWQVAKYVARCKHKANYLQDLEKARFYLREAIIIEKAGAGPHWRPKDRYSVEEVLDDWFDGDDSLRAIMHYLYLAVKGDAYLRFLTAAEETLTLLIVREAKPREEA